MPVQDSNFDHEACKESDSGDRIDANMLTEEPECPAYAEYFAQSPLRTDVAGPGATVVAGLTVVAADVCLLLEEHATRTTASIGTARDATNRRRRPFDVIDSSPDPRRGFPVHVSGIIGKMPYRIKGLSRRHSL